MCRKRSRLVEMGRIRPLSLLPEATASQAITKGCSDIKVKVNRKQQFFAFFLGLVLFSQFGLLEEWLEPADKTHTRPKRKRAKSNPRLRFG